MIRKVTIGVLLLTSLLSCNDEFLNPTPSTSLSSEEVFDSYTTAETALIGVYDQLSSYTFEGHMNPMLGDIIGEDVLINSANNYNWFVDVYQLNVQPNYLYATQPWNSGYKIIHDANRIIEGAIKLEDDRKEKLIAEAKVIRAFTMLKLVEMFAPAYSIDPDAPGILLVSRVVGVEEPDAQRSSIRVVYEQITSDLLAAADVLASNDNSGFFDKYAAQALLARAYLDMGDWQQARDMAISARDNSILMDNSIFSSGFYSANSETIFSLAYTADDNNIYLSIPSFYWPVSGYSSMRASKGFVDLFSSNDWRVGFQFHEQDDIDPDNVLILKFQHNQSIGNAERIVIRASEMYLIEAECEAELGNYAAAQNALFKIQSRADVSQTKSTSTGQALVDEILIERRKELYGEGFRWNDIKRRSGRFVRDSDHWAKFNFGVDDSDYYRLTLPIPESEINANDALTQADQNIGY